MPEEKSDAKSCALFGNGIQCETMSCTYHLATPYSHMPVSGSTIQIHIQAPNTVQRIPRDKLIATFSCTYISLTSLQPLIMISMKAGVPLMSCY